MKESFSLITDSGENLVLDSGEEIITDPEAAGPIKTRGVLNTGVAFKGMPVRVFRAESGLEIVDYNIGNVNQSNNFKGDYSHLPKLKPNESLDLFFGLRVGRLSDVSEEVQFVVHTDDGTFNKTDCYGNINFNIGSTKKLEDQKPTQKPVVLPPTDLVHFSEMVIGRNIIAFDDTSRANLIVGEGEYPSVIDIWNPYRGTIVELTLDSILIRENVLLTIYDQPDFKGDILLKETGPKGIYSYNVAFQGNYQKLLDEMDPEKFKGTGILDLNGKIIEDNIKMVDNEVIFPAHKGSMKVEYIG